MNFLFMLKELEKTNSNTKLNHNPNPLNVTLNPSLNPNLNPNRITVLYQLAF